MSDFQAGGAADLLGGGGGGAGAGGAGGEGGAGRGAGGAGGEGGAGGAGGEGGGGAGGEGGGAGDAAGETFLGMFSADGGDAETPAHRDWVKAKGFKDVNALVQSLRDTEKAFRSGGRVVVPGEGAKPEEIEAFHLAIGRPESADKYEVALPKGAELDDAFVGPLREAAFKAGTPAPAFKAMADAFVAHQLDQQQAEVKRQNDETQAKFKEWGDQKDAKLAEAQRFVEHVGMNRDEIAAFQRAVGSGRVFDLFAKLGGGLAEDKLIGGGRGNFGVTAEQAQVELDRMNSDPATFGLLQKKDPATIARRERLIAAVAAAEEAKRKA